MAAYRILYVEDNPQSKRLICKLLQSRGFEVLTAEDGETGVELALRILPDLILMDMSLPVMDGMEVTRLIKAHKELAHIPVIALTANAMRGDRERFLAAGCDDYMPKPIDIYALLGLVHRYLD
jgi:two-component system cell cycle response regulator DivK